jgi:DNA-binding transcriptional LysR family regulator
MENLNDILVFVRVVEKGSFSTAARDLGLSAAAVSRHVNQLDHRRRGRFLQAL